MALNGNNGSVLGALYRPHGLALETAKAVLGVDDPWAVNTGLGCEFGGCLYCYGHIAYHKQNWNDLRIAKVEVIKNFAQDVEKKRPEGVFLSFATDTLSPSLLPYTFHILKVLAEKNIPCATLSKRADVAFPFEGVHHTGKTIVSFDAQFWKTQEPKASPPLFRLESLKQAQHPWVSVEPYPCPAIHKQDTYTFLETLAQCKPELIVFGKWNYDKRATGPEAREYYRVTVNEFTNFCQAAGIKLHVKSETLAYIKNGKEERNC